MKKIFAACTIFMLISALFVFYGCGQTQGGGGSTTNYTIGGKLFSLTASGITPSAASTVTHIVAIGSNNTKYLADLSSDGTFSIKLNKGYPCAIGFYNKTGSTITYLGHLVKSDVNWDSLPVMDPKTDSVDLGTIEVNSTSLEATPSIDVTTLIDSMKMVDSTTASYYGEIDDPMVVFTNLDIDGNGEFDFVEDKSYLFAMFFNMGPGTGASPGQIARMAAGYNDDYKPVPFSYGPCFSAQNDAISPATPLTVTAPVTLTNPSSLESNTMTGLVSDDATFSIWNTFFRLNDSSIVKPESVPPGTYTVIGGGKTYTIKNVKGSEIIKVNSNTGIIYPVFHLVTNEAGYVTTVQYKWKKVVAGAITDAGADEVKASIENTSATGSTFVHASPFIDLRTAAKSSGENIVKFDRDSASADVSSLGVKLSEVNYIQVSYNLNSRIVCKFDFE
jgi:hypothetical protein